MAKVLFFHGGGPTAVLNSGLAGALDALQSAGSDQLYYARYGIAKVLKDGIRRFPQLDRDALSKLSRSPGSAIGSGRDHLEDEDYGHIAAILADQGFSHVIGSGGNGTMDTVRRLARACAGHGITVTGIPKTMDNDLSLTDHSPGFISAALYMAGSVREAMYDVKGLPIHVVVIESFGRNAGWITAASALASTADVPGPDMILLPETDYDEDAFLERVEELYSAKGGVVVVASEGLHYKDGTPIVDPVFQVGRSVYFGDVSAKLSQTITKRLGIKSRSEKPGILSRSSIAWQSALDRDEAYACGQASALAALEGRNGTMSIITRTSDEPYGSRIDVVDISDEILFERCMPSSFIDAGGFGVSDEFRSYMSPLLSKDRLGDFMTFTC